LPGEKFSKKAASAANDPLVLMQLSPEDGSSIIYIGLHKDVFY